jgi:hypothetical protein
MLKWWPPKKVYRIKNTLYFFIGRKLQKIREPELEKQTKNQHEDHKRYDIEYQGQKEIFKSVMLMLLIRGVRNGIICKRMSMNYNYTMACEMKVPVLNLIVVQPDNKKKADKHEQNFNTSFPTHSMNHLLYSCKYKKIGTCSILNARQLQIIEYKTERYYQNSNNKNTKQPLFICGKNNS